MPSLVLPIALRWKPGALSQGHWNGAVLATLGRAREEVEASSGGLGRRRATRAFRAAGVTGSTRSQVGSYPACVKIPQQNSIAHPILGFPGCLAARRALLPRLGSRGGGWGWRCPSSRAAPGKAPQSPLAEAAGLRKPAVVYQPCPEPAPEVEVLLPVFLQTYLLHPTATPASDPESSDAK